MLSCLNIIISRIEDSVLARVRRETSPLKVSVSHVCSVGLGGNEYEVFMVKDGIFLLYNGESFKVKRQ